jgi:hypothetical protein
VSIESKILSYFGELEHDEHHRYRSWEHCYRYFQKASPSRLSKDRDDAAIRLGFYLASWGMYRGKSFLLQRAKISPRGSADVEARLLPALRLFWSE